MPGGNPPGSNGGGGAPRKFTAAEVADALREARGLVSVAAKKLRCSRKMIYAYMERHPTVEEARYDEKEEFKDFLEAQFQHQVEANYWPAVQYGLKTLCKDRGYVERWEHRHGGDADAPPISAIRIVEAPTREMVQRAREEQENGHRS